MGKKVTTSNVGSLIPSWKRWLSYLWEIPIESVHSEVNPDLHVSLIRGRFQLYTERAIYSFDDLYDNFGHTFSKLRLQSLPGGQVLILGFGLGSIALLLDAYDDQTWHYTGIEKDEAVLYLAHQYAIPRIQHPIQLIQTDAHLFINQCQTKYDLICMDIFVDDVVPETFKTTTFLNQLNQVLNPGGLLLFNKLSRTAVDLEATTTYYEDIFSPFFSNATYLVVDGNHLLLSDQRFLKGPNL